MKSIPLCVVGICGIVEDRNFGAYFLPSSYDKGFGDSRIFELHNQAIPCLKFDPRIPYDVAPICSLQLPPVVDYNAAN